MPDIIQNQLKSYLSMSNHTWRNSLDLRLLSHYSPRILLTEAMSTLAEAAVISAVTWWLPGIGNRRLAFRALLMLDRSFSRPVFPRTPGPCAFLLLQPMRRTKCCDAYGQGRTPIRATLDLQKVQDHICEETEKGERKYVQVQKELGFVVAFETVTEGA